MTGRDRHTAHISEGEKEQAAVYLHNALAPEEAPVFIRQAMGVLGMLRDH